MTRITPVQLTLFTLPNLSVRAYSYKSIENGLYRIVTRKTRTGKTT